jgi:hypothetical protein
MDKLRSVGLRILHALQVAKRRCVALWTELPILGPLAYCTASHHKSAAKEFSVTVLFSTATFWLSALFLKALMANKGLSYFELIGTTVKSGELFIFTVAFLGPILITAAEDPHNAKEFPDRMWHFLALMALALIAAGFFALIKTAYSDDIAKPLFDKEFLFEASITTALCALLLRYLALVYRKQTLISEKELKNREGAFADAFSARHGGQP